MNTDTTSRGDGGNMYRVEPTWTGLFPLFHKFSREHPRLEWMNRRRPMIPEKKRCWWYVEVLCVDALTERVYFMW